MYLIMVVGFVPYTTHNKYIVCTVGKFNAQVSTIQLPGPPPTESLLTFFEKKFGEVVVVVGGGGWWWWWRWGGGPNNTQRTRELG